MYYLHIEQKELWNEKTNQFMYVGPSEPKDLKLEHSLVSVSKWESKYKKSFTNTEHKTLAETIDYIAMMVLDEEVDPNWFVCLTNAQIEDITKYIKDPMTATTVPEDKKNKGVGRTKGQIVTNELVYYWMTALNIPFECQYWHFNRLITLIKVCAFESDPDKKKKKKMTSADMAARKARMDAARARNKH